MAAIISWRKLLAAFVGGIILAGAVRADMVPVSGQGAGCRRLTHVCGRMGVVRDDSRGSSAYSSIAELSLSPVEFIPELNVDPGRASETQPSVSLTNGLSSLSLCLSALMSLGLWGCAHWVKEMSLGLVPEWYHSGGPLQIGHSLAVLPESLCPVPACCFIQPFRTVEPLTTHCRLGRLMSFWRQSQFTPGATASRGPPYMS
jgi:hypothetical protein